MRKLFSSESVTCGHPDKVCDQIADAILDALLEKDPSSRVACEVIAEPGRVHIMGEITSKASVDYKEIARSVIRGIGYTDEKLGFTDKCEITETIHAQSPDISMGVDSSFDEKDSSGAGDQGIMFGYAIDETEEEMPLAISLARKLTALLTEKRESGELPYLRPDGKSQVTIEYDGRDVKRIEAVVVSAQHDEEISLDKLREDIKEKIILEGLPKELIDENTKFYINPTGRFVLGGPAADTGLTGRKLIVDTYAYAIGVAKPVSLELDTFGTAKVSEEEILKVVEKHYDLRPDAIIKRFSLRNPQYLATSKTGHFGVPSYAWEKVDESFIEDLKKLV